ncbi:unnamed protein product [Auanema sp. JU1783]|nr:unnamed protein product [Auanema sp. JU1783]
MKYYMLLLLTTCSLVVANESYENDSENFPPKVAWVPIVQRNMTETINKALEGNEDKIARISKMLEKSYEQISHDIAEGQTLMHELELKSKTNFSPSTMFMTICPILILQLF